MNISWVQKIIYPNIFVNLFQGYWGTTKIAKSKFPSCLYSSTHWSVGTTLPMKGCSLQCVPHCSPFSQSIYNQQGDENYF